MRPMTPLLLSALFALAAVSAGCDPATIDDDDSGTADGGSGSGDGGDGGEGDGGAVDGDVTALTWRLHPDSESMPVVGWTQAVAADAHVEYSFENDEWHSSPTFAAAAGAHEQVLLGIPFEYPVQWRVVVGGADPVDGETLTTGDLPDGLPVGELTVAAPDAWLPTGNYLLTSINQTSGGWRSGKYWTFIIDRQGRPVWAMLTPDSHWTLYAQVSVGRDTLLIDEATLWSDWDDGAGSMVHERYLDEEVLTIDTPGLHHAFVQLPDTTLAWGSQYHGNGEVLVEKELTGGEEREIWAAEDDWTGERNTESNGLFYVEATDTYLYSFYTNNSLVEVDRQGGSSIWWAGEAAGGYAFVPASSQFSWQHGISYTDSGSLLVSSEYRGSNGQEETWLLEYEVDQEERTLTYIWGSSSDTLADTNGDAWRLDNGNTLHVVGAAGVVREVDADGEDVWRVDFNSERLLGRGELIEDLYTLAAPQPAR